MNGIRWFASTWTDELVVQDTDRLENVKAGVVIVPVKEVDNVFASIDDGTVEVVDSLV